jgi:hypothetical protein
MSKVAKVDLTSHMQFEDQSAAMRQMKELLRDQAKFRAKLDRVVRKIETSSQRTAKLAERNKTRKPSSKTVKPHLGEEQSGSEKLHGDKLHAFDDVAGNHQGNGNGNGSSNGNGSNDGHHADGEGGEPEIAMASAGQGSS